MDFTGANFSGADSELISVMQTSREPIQPRLTLPKNFAEDNLTGANLSEFETTDINLGEKNGKVYFRGYTITQQQLNNSDIIFRQTISELLSISRTIAGVYFGTS